MAKTIIKEIVIILLATLAIGLVLAVIFYQFVPSNKVIPGKVSEFKVSEEVQAELEAADSTELSSVNEVYEVTDSDLSKYKASKSYTPGKVDPFAEVSENVTGNVTGVGNQTVNPGTVDKNTTDNFYTSANVNAGTK